MSELSPTRREIDLYLELNRVQRERDDANERLASMERDLELVIEHRDAYLRQLNEIAYDWTSVTWMYHASCRVVQEWSDASSGPTTIPSALAQEIRKLQSVIDKAEFAKDMY